MAKGYHGLVCRRQAPRWLETLSVTTLLGPASFIAHAARPPTQAYVGGLRLTKFTATMAFFSC